jgi:hypothetical protein
MPFNFGNVNTALGIINIYTLIIFNLGLFLSIKGGLKASSNILQQLFHPELV